MGCGSITSKRAKSFGLDQDAAASLATAGTARRRADGLSGTAWSRAAAWHFQARNPGIILGKLWIGSNILLALLASGLFSPKDAAAMAGRLCFSVTLAASRAGRAFMKPCDAQQFCPMQGGMISVRLYMAMRWVIKISDDKAAC